MYLKAQGSKAAFIFLETAINWPVNLVVVIVIIIEIIIVVVTVIVIINFFYNYHLLRSPCLNLLI